MTTPTKKELFLAIRANDPERLRTLVRHDHTLLEAVSPLGVSPVLFAVYYGHPELARLLVQEGAPLNVFEAAATGETGRLNEQLDADPALVNALSPDGFTPLGLAAFFGQEEVAALLLSRGADVNALSRNAMQVQPLHSAVAGNHLRLAARLLEAGAQVNAAQSGGFTPLMEAARNGNAALVETLLAHGATVEATNDDGRRAADLAEEEGHTAVAALLSPRQPQENGKAIGAGTGDTGTMSDERNANPNVIGSETTGETGAKTGFDTPDPKDDHQVVYTTTPPEDRVGSSDHGLGAPPEAPSSHDVTSQFDKLATRDVSAMEHTPEDAEFAGAQTVAGLGGENLDEVVPAPGLGVSPGLATSVEPRMRDIDPNPGYTPPSEEVPPHVGERPGDLPAGEPAELEHQIRDGTSNKRR
ncbi:ankyrin repeat domain-containing protein [Deinococcus aerophilus]|uniref:Ankyrin repeat domain-containing protein n=1 Tax=Deinococcus aerophilus TaxID=522488 RepID=A0ABQ2GIN2_9DEIO|nr:ankyrin repeat domain-containing protein [Deinococcus aerophilus]GGL97506.1 hypothetical protein GCM10010841_02360 [Deinococcus aerophilus]